MLLFISYTKSLSILYCIIFYEFLKWRRVLEEALGSSDVLPKDEIKMGDEIKVPPCEPEIWISYPRTFSRAAARFDLPTNKTLLNGKQLVIL